MRHFSLLLALCVAFAAIAAAATLDTKAPKVYFISPLDGARLKSPFMVRFGLSNWGVAPAGTQTTGTGHHHLLIDVDPPEDGSPIPSDANNIHFGHGHTEAFVELAPGTYKLRLVVGDGNHVPIEGLVSEVITVDVVPD